MEIQIIWKEYHHKLRSYINQQVNDEALSDDLLQEVFIKINRNINTLKDQEKLSNWLYRITKNTIIDHYRKNQIQHLKYDENSINMNAFEVSPETTLKNLAQCLLPIINQLPKAYKEAIHLCEIEGYTQKKVAHIIGLSESGAKSRIQRGRAQMKELLLSCCTVELDTKGRITSFDEKPNAKNFCK